MKTWSRDGTDIAFEITLDEGNKGAQTQEQSRPVTGKYN